ncbi:aquaporin Z, partial [Vibrio harveyi]
LRCAYL